MLTRGREERRGYTDVIFAIKEEEEEEEEEAEDLYIVCKQVSLSIF